MNRQRQYGFTIIETLLIVVAAIIVGSAGWYVWHLETRPAAKPVAHQGTAANQYDQFLACAQATTKLSKVKGVDTCTKDGASYSLPSSLSQDMIVNFDKIPISGRPTILAEAESQYQACATNSSASNYPDQVAVQLAQSNFVAITEGCAGGATYFFGESGSKWSFLGGTQSGLLCQMTDQYDVKATSVLVNSSGLNECVTSSGAWKQLPQ